MDFIDTDFIFRLVCGALLIIQTFSRIWMTRNKPSSEKSKFFQQQQQSLFIRLSGGAVFLAYLYVFLPDSHYFDFSVPSLFRWVGAGLMLIGNTLFIASHHALGKQWSPHLEIREGHRLIESGIYRWIRHPMYTGFILFGLGMVFLSANYYGCAYFVVIGVMIATRLRAEEDMLLQEFGDEYRKYQSHTSALFPGIF